MKERKMDTNIGSPYRELAYRTSDGLEVMLFWDQGTAELFVSVSDERSGAHFGLEAEPNQALDVFTHPYAHAASRGLRYEEASLPCGPKGSFSDGQIGPDVSESPADRAGRRDVK
jgi:hypothetical protein